MFVQCTCRYMYLLNLILQCRQCLERHYQCWGVLTSLGCLDNSFCTGCYSANKLLKSTQLEEVSEMVYIILKYTNVAAAACTRAVHTVICILAFVIGSRVCCVHIGFENAMLQFVLKKFLLLVLLLDQAKLTRLIDYDPCLFLKESEIKVH